MAENNNPIKYSDLIQPDNSLENLIKQLGEANDMYMRFAQNIKDKAIKVKAQIEGVSSATAIQRKVIADTAKESEKLAKSYKDIEAAIESTGKEILEVKAIQDSQIQTQKELSRSTAELANATKEITGINFKSFLSENESGLVSYNSAITQASNALTKNVSIQIEYDKALADNKISTTEHAKQIKILEQEYLKAENAFNEFTKAQKDGKNAMVGETLQDANAAFQRSSAEVQSLSKNLISLKIEQDAVKESIKETEQSFKANTISQAQYEERIAGLTIYQKSLAAGVKVTTRELDLQVKIADTAAGSYDNLSAQYSANKITLNGMSAAMRNNTEAGQEFEKQTGEIYEEMNQLQIATGKHQLQVGNYGIATAKLTTQIRENTYALAQMRMAGEENSAEYQKLQQETADLQSALQNTRKEINSMASNTSTLGAVMSGITGASGAFSAFNGAMQAFGGESEKVAEAQKTLQASIAITTGLTAVQANLHKQSAVMLGINAVQTKALSKAQVYQRLIQIQGTKATTSAIVTQKLFNLVASANPYVLLAMALVTVVGALMLFSSGTKNAAKEQEKLNEIQAREATILDERAKSLTRESKLRQDDLQAQIALLQAQGKSLEEIRAIEDKLFEERKSNANEMAKLYGADILLLERNKEKSKELIAELDRLNNVANKKKKVNIEINGKQFRVKVKDAVEMVQKELDNTNTKIEIATEVVNTVNNVNNDEAITIAERKKQAQVAAKAELDIIRKSQYERIKLIADTYDKERVQTQNNFKRQIADLKTQLKQDANLSVNSRKAINAQIIFLQAQLNNALIDIDNKLAADKLNMLRTQQDYQLAAMDEGIEKERIALNMSYNRQIEDLKTRLRTEISLTEEQRLILNKNIVNLEIAQLNEVAKLHDDHDIKLLQRQEQSLQNRLDATREGSQEEIALTIDLIEQRRKIELAQNRQLAEELRQDEAEINSKYNALRLREEQSLMTERAMMMFDLQQELNQTEFDLLKTTEEEKTRFRLRAEAERWKKILELNQTNAEKLSDEEVKIIENTMARINKEIAKSESKKGLLESAGVILDDAEKQAISDSLKYAIDAVFAFMDAKIKAADKAVESSTKEVDAGKARLQGEIDARNNGYASNVIQAQKDLDLAKRTQDKAIADQKKAQKERAKIETLQQVGSLITASAQIWSQLGFPWAIPAIAVMFGSFALSKIKANQMAKSETYGDGTVELLKGGSHYSGNDIDLGTKPDGTKRRAEGGEYFAVFNKRKSRKYHKLIPDVVNAINKGEFERKYLNAYDTAGVSLMLNGNKENPDLDQLKNDVSAIKKQNERRYVYHANGKVTMYYKNLKRTYTA